MEDKAKIKKLMLQNLDKDNTINTYIDRLIRKEQEIRGLCDQIKVYKDALSRVGRVNDGRESN